MTVKFMSAASPGIVGAPPAVWDLHQGTSGAPTTGTCTPELQGPDPVLSWRLVAFIRDLLLTPQATGEKLPRTPSTSCCLRARLETPGLSRSLGLYLSSLS